MRDFSVSIKRLGVLKQESLKQLKDELGVDVKIDRRTGVVEVVSPEENGGAEWTAEQVLNALVEGFEPKHAFKLLKDENYHEVIDLDAAFYRKEKQIHRAKSRVIGEDGKAKKMLENLTGTALALPDDEEVVAIIGPHEGIQSVKEAILRLLEGASHKSVFSYLEGRNRQPF